MCVLLGMETKSVQQKLTYYFLSCTNHCQTVEIFSFEMDLISQYHGSSSEDEIPDKELNVRQIRQVYLVTQSKADLSKFPNRESFSEAGKEGFSGFSAKILQWVCSKERHRN